jgi:hypothetical protein
MALFVKLTGVDNIEQFINLEHVTRMVHFGGAQPFTRVYFDNENSITVKETPHHILGGLPADQIASPRS